MWLQAENKAQTVATHITIHNAKAVFCKCQFLKKKSFDISFYTVSVCISDHFQSEIQNC